MPYSRIWLFELTCSKEWQVFEGDAFVHSAGDPVTTL
jgi:hypothetical protein